MKNWINEDGVVGDCPWMQDIEDARRVADQIGIPSRSSTSCATTGRRSSNTCSTGTRGAPPRIPTSCATARSSSGYSARGPRERILGGRDGTLRTSQNRRLRHRRAARGRRPEQGPDVFSRLLGQDQLRGARFPIGDLEKPEVRRIARAAGLRRPTSGTARASASSARSGWAISCRAYVPDRPGPVVGASDGRELGRHRGPSLFHARPAQGNRRPVERRSRALRRRRQARRRQRAACRLRSSRRSRALPVAGARSLDQLDSGEPVERAGPLEGRVRYRDPRVPLLFEPDGGATGLVRFRSPQRALAAGQVLALYEGERLLGGAVYA
jgi:tRNA-specific 2-thiouridylase